jgi:hypothetical protein
LAPLEKNVDTHQQGMGRDTQLDPTLSRLADLLERRSGEDDEDRSSERLTHLGANYVQLCGTLAGFCGAFVLFLLSPGLFPDRAPEASVVLMLVASFGYVYASAWSALAPVLSPDVASRRLRLSDVLFTLCNLLVWASFTIVLFSLGYRFATAAALLLLVLAVAASAAGVVRRQL